MIESINPSTGETVKSYTESTSSDVAAAVSRLSAHQANWMKQPKALRIELVQHLSQHLEREKPKIEKAILEEAGIPSSEFEPVFFDILAGIEYYSAQYAQQNVRDFPLDNEVQPNTSAKVHLFPHGVIGHIGIWNYPFWQTMITAIPALLTGNSILYKPSEFTTGTGLLLAELLYECGVPENVFQVVLAGTSHQPSATPR